MDTRCLVVIPEMYNSVSGPLPISQHVAGQDIIPGVLKGWRYRAPDGQFYIFRGTVRKVKNLRWLLVNWKRVERFQVDKYGLMFAFLRGGGYYRCQWADIGVCREWLKRPVFKGCALNWLGEDTKC